MNGMKFRKNLKTSTSVMNTYQKLNFQDHLKVPSHMWDSFLQLKAL